MRTDTRPGPQTAPRGRVLSKRRAAGEATGHRETWRRNRRIGVLPFGAARRAVVLIGTAVLPNPR
jgi:hypothetical protein